MSDKNTATLRTAWNAAILAVATQVVAWLAGNGWAIDTSSPWFALGVTAVAGAGYRASLELVAWAERYPWVGWVLFGRSTPPSY